jgi:Raf kinase inhibitor-like YbhB/YbcL family protein
MSNRNSHLAHGEHHKPEAKQPDHSGKAITILKVEAYEHLGITVVSSAIDLDGRLDPLYSADQDNTSPPLGWSGIAEAESYALVVEDPDAPREQPFIHWMIWNIPSHLVELPVGIPLGRSQDELAGAIQGKNDLGEYGWYGMKPPPGHGPHHYHFQLFALNRMLDLGPDTPLATLVNELKGAAVAKGEVVGIFETPETI